MDRQKNFDKRFLIVALVVGFVVPLLFLINNFFSHQPTSWEQIITNGIFTFCITLSITWINTSIANRIGRKYPWKQGWAKRLGIELLLTSISAAIIIWIIASVLFVITDFHHQYSYGYMVFMNAVISVIINIILITGLEGWELFGMYKNSLIESEKLKRQNIESQYSALINQVNPHFLFNSLNVLSFLVSTNPEKAQEFISRFSWIYRYVLDVKDKSLVSLEQEMEFLNAYIFLQKLRYEDKLEFRVDISLPATEVYIPPLSLQILVENAIKHNEISFQYPMNIEVFIENDFLVVKNPVQIRMDKEESTGFGLKHLLARYEHFTNREPVFGHVGNDYVARIPLLFEEQ